jgi:hypothetical protein
VRPGGLGQLKNLLTSLGIQPATFRLVAYCVDRLRYSAHLYKVNAAYKIVKKKFKPFLNSISVENWPRCVKNPLTNPRDGAN